MAYLFKQINNTVCKLYLNKAVCCFFFFSKAGEFGFKEAAQAQQSTHW